MYGPFKCQPRRYGVDGYNCGRTIVEPLKELRDKGALFGNLRFACANGRDVGDTPNTSYAAINLRKRKIYRPGTHGLEMPHSKSAESAQFVFFDGERYLAVLEQTDGKCVIHAGNAESGTFFHKPDD